jgi:plastocyanin
MRGPAGAACLLVLLAAGCRGDSAPEARPPLLELAADTIELPAGTALVEVRLSEAAGAGVIEPERVMATVGDVVRFVAADARGYSVRFEVGRLTAEQAAFLEATQQQASPPLIGTGAAWVVTLEDAPAGEYPFLSANHGTPGVLVVR